MRRFPIGITIAAAIGLAILVGLGQWQMRRLAWKTQLLGRIAASAQAQAQPIQSVLARAAAGANVSFIRVEAHCLPPAGGAPQVYRYAMRNLRVGWRLMGFCRLAGAPWSGVVLDRGVTTALAGRMAPRAGAFSAPAMVVGVLRAPGKSSFLDTPPQRQPDGSVSVQSINPAAMKLIAGPGAAPAPWYLAVEQEIPAPAGIQPVALPPDLPNNHFVYALVWFGLAVVLVFMWAGYVIQWVRER